MAMLCSLRLTFKKRRVLHGSLSDASIVQFCVGTNAVCERRCRCGRFASLFSATGRRNSVGFRSRRTPTDVVSRMLAQALRLLHEVKSAKTTSATCPSRKSYPHVAMMQSGQDLCGDDGP